MTEPWSKFLSIFEAILLLLPLTLFAILFGWLSYAAYPPPDPQAIQMTFDSAALLVAAGIVATWRLVIGHLRGGQSALHSIHAAWFAVTGLAALIGILGGAVAVQHMLYPNYAPNYVGFSLLAPAGVLAVLYFHLLRERRRAQTQARTTAARP